MTHPITPPPELVRQWANESPMECSAESWAYELFIAHHAAQWGADQELEACLSEVSFLNSKALADRVRAARRPKPPSLKEQALAELDKVDMLWDTDEFGKETLGALDTIRRALEALPE
jgi:hypothetical protein